MLLCFKFLSTSRWASTMGIHSLGTCPDARSVTPGATKRPPAPPTTMKARSAGLLDALNEAIRSTDDLVSVVRWRPIGRDDRVRAIDDAGDLCRIAEVVLDCGDVLEFSHLLWSARCRDDGSLWRRTSHFVASFVRVSSGIANPFTVHDQRWITSTTTITRTIQRAIAPLLLARSLLT